MPYANGLAKEVGTASPQTYLEGVTALPIDQGLLEGLKNLLLRNESPVGRNYAITTVSTP